MACHMYTENRAKCQNKFRAKLSYCTWGSTLTKEQKHEQKHTCSRTFQTKHHRLLCQADGADPIFQLLQCSEQWF